jgi:predicted TIM-barrel fold metal-dependent hydrolase
MVIDFHAHAFSEKIVQKAIHTISENSGGIVSAYNGTVSELVKYADENDIDYCVLLNITTNEAQTRAVNDFAVSSNGGKIISFGSVYPLAENAVDELYRIHDAGLKGVKLHPDYQEFYADDKKVFKIYETISKLGLITVFHAGVDLGRFERDYSSPERISNALPAFNNAPVVAAHFGGLLQWIDVEKYLVGKNIYFDTSYCYSRMPRLQAQRIVSNHGADKILFGSDMPWSSATNEKRFVESLKLPDYENQLIFGKNAAKLLGL